MFKCPECGIVIDSQEDEEYCINCDVKMESEEDAMDMYKRYRDEYIELGRSNKYE